MGRARTPLGVKPSVSLEVGLGVPERAAELNGRRRWLDCGEEVSAAVADGGVPRWLGGASLAVEGRLEWDAKSKTYWLRGPALDMELAGYLTGLMGVQVKVYVADGRGGSWKERRRDAAIWMILFTRC